MEQNTGTEIAGAGIKRKKMVKRLGILLLLAMIVLVCYVTNFPKKQIDFQMAKRSACTYYQEKYGEKFQVIRYEEVYSYNFMFPCKTGVCFYGKDGVGIYVSNSRRTIQERNGKQLQEKNEKYTQKKNEKYVD